MDFVTSYFRFRANVVDVEIVRTLLKSPNILPLVLDRFRMNCAFMVKTRTRPYVCINMGNLMIEQSAVFRALFSQSHYVQEADGDYIYFTYFLSSSEEPYNDQRMFYYEPNKDRFQQIHEIPGIFSNQLTYLSNVAYYTAAATGDYFGLYRVGQNVLTPLNEIFPTQWYQFYATQFTSVPVYSNDNVSRVFAPPSSKDFKTSVGNWRFNTPTATSQTQDTTFGQATVYLNNFTATLDLYLVSTPGGLRMTLAIEDLGERSNPYSVGLPDILELIDTVNDERIISKFTDTGFREGSTDTTTLSSVSQVQTNILSWLASIASSYGYQFDIGTGLYPSSYPALVPIATMSKITPERPEAEFRGYMTSMTCDWTDLFRQYELDRRTTPNQFSFNVLRTLFDGPQTFDSAAALVRTGNNNIIQYLQPEQIRNYIRMEIYPFDLTKESEFIKLRVQGISGFALDTVQFSKGFITFFTDTNSQANPNPLLPPIFPTRNIRVIDLGICDTLFRVTQNRQTYQQVPTVPLKDWDQQQYRNKNVPVPLIYSGIRTYACNMELQTMPVYVPPGATAPKTGITYLTEKCLINSLPENQVPPASFTLTIFQPVPTSTTQGLQGLLLNFGGSLVGDRIGSMFARFDAIMTSSVYSVNQGQSSASLGSMDVGLWIETGGIFNRVGGLVNASDLITYLQQSAAQMIGGSFPIGAFRVLVCFLPDPAVFRVQQTIPLRIGFNSVAFPWVNRYHAPVPTYERALEYADIYSNRNEVLHFQGLYYWSTNVAPIIGSSFLLKSASNCQGLLYARGANDPIVSLYNVPTYQIPSTYSTGFTSNQNVLLAATTFQYGIQAGIILDYSEYFPGFNTNFMRQKQEEIFSSASSVSLTCAEPYYFRRADFAPDSADLDAFQSSVFTGFVLGPVIGSTGQVEIGAWLTSIPITPNDNRYWDILIPLDDLDNQDRLKMQLVTQSKYNTGSISYSTQLVTNANSLYQWNIFDVGYSDNAAVQVVVWQTTNNFIQRYLRFRFQNTGITSPLPMSNIFVKFSLLQDWQGNLPTTYAWQRTTATVNPLLSVPQMLPLINYQSNAADDLVQITSPNLFQQLQSYNFIDLTQLVVKVNAQSTCELAPGTIATWKFETWIDGTSTAPTVYSSGLIGNTIFGGPPLLVNLSDFEIPNNHTYVRFVIYVSTGEYSTLIGAEQGGRDIILDLEIVQDENLEDSYAGKWPGAYAGKAFYYETIVTQWPFTLRMKRSIQNSDLIVTYAIVDPAIVNPNNDWPQCHLVVKEDTVDKWFFDVNEYYLEIPLPQNATTSVGLRMQITLEVEVPLANAALEISYTTISVTIDPTNTIFSANNTPIYITLPLTDEEMFFWGEIYLANPKIIQFYIELELALVGGKRDYIWPQFSEFTAIAMKEGDNSNTSTMLVLTDNAENYGYQSSYYSILYSQVEGNQRFFWQKFLQRPTALFLTTMSPIKLQNFDIWDYKLRRNLILFFR